MADWSKAPDSMLDFFLSKGTYGLLWSNGFKSPSWQGLSYIFDSSLPVAKTLNAHNKVIFKENKQLRQTKSLFMLNKIFLWGYRSTALNGICQMSFTQNSAWHIVCGVVANFRVSTRISNKVQWVWIITSCIKYICYGAAAEGAMLLWSQILYFHADIFPRIHIPNTVGINIGYRVWAQGWNWGVGWVL